MLDTIIARAEYECLQDLGVNIRLTKDIIYAYYKYNKDTPQNKVLQFNPTPQLVASKGYFPNITLSYNKSQYNTGYYVHYLKIQCSVTKILYGNSYFMNDEEDLELFCSELANKLNIIGIGISAQQVRKLSLQSASFSYNIILPERFGRPIGFLKKLSVLDVGKHIRNVMNTEYNESAEGYCERRYSQNTGYRMYDKGSEIINQAKTPSEILLRDKLVDRAIPANILRLEKCYQNKKTLKKLLNPFYKKPPKDDVCLEQVFNNGLCKIELTDMMGKLGKTMNLITADIADKNPFLTAEYVMRLSKKLGLKGHEIDYFTTFALSASQMGVKNTVTLYDEIHGRQGQKDRSKYANIINNKLIKADLSNFGLVALFKIIREQLTAFKIYKNEQQAQEIYEVVEALNKPKVTPVIKLRKKEVKPKSISKEETLSLFAGIEG